MSRSLLVAVLLALLPAAAPAQGSDRKAAVGGGSYNDAPLLEPGSYRDTIRPGERLFYAFDVKAGQRLRVRAVVPGNGGPIPGADIFALGIETPLREVELAAASEDLTGHGTFVTTSDTPIEYRTAPAPTFAASEDPTGSEYRGPGTYFVSLDLQTSNPEPLPIENEVELDVSVEGTPQAEPTPERTPAPAATPTPAPAEERGGGWAAGLLLAALAGLLVGLALAAVRRLTGRRRRTA